MMKLVVALFLLLLSLDAFSSPSTITSIQYHRWTDTEISQMYTVGTCRVAGSDLTEYDDSGHSYGQWCCWATSAQVTLVFTTPNASSKYYVQWKPWRLKGDFVLDGVTYRDDWAQGWTTISLPITPIGAQYTFQSGIVEDTGFFRIMEVMQ